MSIYEAFKGWRQSNASLLKTDLKNEEYDPVDVAEAASYAKDELNITAKRGRYIIPLFEEDEPELTDEYVYYRPEKENIGCIDSGFGAPRNIDCEDLETTEIGHRLRYWIPENRPEPEIDVDESELPDERISPTDRLTDSEQQQFFNQLRNFVISERDAKRDAKWEEYTEFGLETAIRRNRISGPFVYLSRVSGERGKPAYRYQFTVDEGEDEEDVDLRDEESLFQGNHCILDIEDATDDFPIEVELLSVDDPVVKFQPKWSTIKNQNAVQKLLESDESEVWLHELLNPVPFDRRLEAIQQVRKNDQKRKLLAGERAVGFSVNKYALPEGDIELNQYQRLALIWADSAEDVVCIHGPPGTGKTRTLTAYVRHAVSKGQSVLVTAHSNQAVDNLLVGDSTRGSPEEDTLHAMAQDYDTDLSIARVGGNSGNSVVQANYVGNSTHSADVVAATTSGASKFNANSFDVAVVDEATQASRPATSIVLNCARKLVLAGDHKQLPPYCADESMQEEEMHVSLFEYLLNRYDDQISILLQKQYRMNEEIATFPSRSFYEGDLETADRNRDWTVDGLKPLMGIQIDGREQRQEHGNSFYNPEEAEAVAKQVQLLVNSGLDTEDIGVITAYNGQIGHIGGRINNLDIEEPRKVSVDTVDSFQGSEREAVIVSFVRSNDRGNSGFLEFPDEGPRRLNVALTRARKRLVLIGDWNTLGTVPPHRSADESCADLYAKLEEHIRKNERMLSL